MRKKEKKSQEEMSRRGHSAVTGGEGHSLAIKTDGTVWVWGDNTSKQLGLLGYTVARRPVQLPGLTGVVSVAAGWRHSMALEGDPGPVWTWGSDSRGQLGNDYNTSPFPGPLPGYMEACSEIAAGGLHSMARYKDLVFVWGDNENRQLADPSIPNSQSPRAIPGLDRADGISGGGAHTLVLRSGLGELLGCGAGGAGQLASDTAAPFMRSELEPVTGLPVLTGVSAGELHNLALDANGRVWSWGFNMLGQIGNGTRDAALVPVRVPRLKKIQAVAAGGFHSLALTQDSTVLAWGKNGNGQLGVEDWEFRTRPTKVVGLEGIVAIGAGLDHSLAITQSGEVWTWGRNERGQLGNGGISDSNVPVRVAGLTDAGFPP